MRIFNWFFGKRDASATETADSPAQTSERTPREELTIPPQPQTPAVNAEREPIATSTTDNLRRWRESGQLRAWVEARQGRWDHATWLALLDELKQSSFWPMDPDGVGLALEDAKREWLSRN